MVPKAESVGGMVPPPPDRTAAVPLTKAQKAKKAYSRVGLAVLLLFLVMQGIGTVIITGGFMAQMIGALLSMGTGNRDGKDFIVLLRQVLSDSTDSMTALTLIGTVVGLIAALLVARAVLRKTPAVPIERKRLSGTEYLFMLLVAMGLWGVGAVVGNIPYICGLESPLDSMMGSGEGFWGILFTLYAMFGAPILEELAFRKLLLDRLNPYGEVPAAFLSALMFGLFHGNSTQFLLAFMVGLAFADVYLKTGNIWYSISFHMIINTVASVTDIAALFTDATEFWGLDFGTWQMILIGLFGIVGTLFAVINRKHPLLSLKRPDYPGCNRAIFRNPGFIIFTVVVSANIVSTDVIALFMNLFERTAGNLLVFHPKAFLVLLPTAIFAVFLIGLLRTVGKHSREPEGVAETAEPAGLSGVYVPAAKAPAENTPEENVPENEGQDTPKDSQ